jgi:hypothetical protein
MSLSFPDASTPLWIQDPAKNSTLPGNGTQLVLPKSETELVYAAPVRNRCWCDLNNGRLLWPVLTGYRYLDGKVNDKKIKEDLSEWRRQRNTTGFPTRTDEPEPESLLEIPVESSTTEEAPEEPTSTSWWRRRPFKRFEKPAPVTPSRTEAYDPQVPEDPYHDDPLMNWDGTTPVSEVEAEAVTPTQSSHIASFVTPTASSWWPSLARSRYDLRMHGIGMVVDFGLTRTEEAVKEEVMEMLDWRERKRAESLPEEVQEEAKEEVVEEPIPSTGETIWGRIAVSDCLTARSTVSIAQFMELKLPSITDIAQSQPTPKPRWLSRFLGRKEPIEEL